MADETFELIDDKKIKGSFRRVLIKIHLSEAYQIKSQPKQALDVLQSILLYQNSLFKNAVLSFSVLEKFKFYRRAALLYEEA